jgi:hypothetical protein
LEASNATATQDDKLSVGCFRHGNDLVGRIAHHALELDTSVSVDGFLSIGKDLMFPGLLLFIDLGNEGVKLIGDKARGRAWEVSSPPPRRATVQYRPPGAATP